jgi:hypothetical protein
MAKIKVNGIRAVVNTAPKYVVKENLKGTPVRELTQEE